MSPNSVEDVVRAIGAGETFLISTHLGPDGDGIGSLLAIRRMLIQMGKQCEAVHVEGVPTLNQFLPDSDAVLRRPERDHYDVAILLDCGDRKRIALPCGSLDQCKVVIDIDHHDPDRAFGDIHWVDPNACATGELITVLAGKLGVPLDEAMATCLYAAMATDTGGFRFANTTPRTLRMCADLIEHGANAAEIMMRLFHERSLATLKLISAALRNAVSEFNGKLVWSKLTREDYRGACATDADTEGVIDILRSAKNCRVAALFRITAKGRSKGSLRSEPPFEVAPIASLFGGGGHPYAAGFSTDLPLDIAVNDVLEKLREMMRSTPA